MNTTPANDTFKQFSETVTKGSQASTKFFEDGFKFWSDMTTRTTDEFRNRVEKMADEMLPASKKSMERFQKMFDDNTQRSFQLVRQGLEMHPVTHPVGTPAEMIDRTTTFFRNAFETTRESTDAMMKFGTDAMRDFSTAFRCDMPFAADTTAKRPTSK
jgi:hypothetical protein